MQLMTLSLARRHGNRIKWLVSVLLIVVVWRFGVYGMDWTSWKSIAALLVAIAVLAFLITFWKRKNYAR
jgi:lipopolysaccharide export LptBFGC system permease protein LptF